MSWGDKLLVLRYCRLDERERHLALGILWFGERWYSIVWQDDKPFDLNLQHMLFRK